MALKSSKGSKGSDGTTRAMRAFQQHTGLLVPLNRMDVLLWISFGLHHNVFTLQQSSPLSSNARHLALKATFTHALEPVPPRAYLVQALFIEDFPRDSVIFARA